MSKIKNISGFPEWLPSQKLLEDQLINTIKGIYQSYGFVPIETPAVELLSTLSSKGVIDKEIYLLKRAKEEVGEPQEGQLALHFDLTVPFARYVSQHFSDLKFPFKRYQLQKVWRGEKPQRGRFREFYQFDIDTIALEDLPLACDAEVISVIAAVFSKIDIGDFTIRINNRKILLGMYSALGLNPEQQKSAIIAVDKIDKIGVAGVEKELSSIGIASVALERIIESTTLRCRISEIKEKISRIDVGGEEFDKGVEEILLLGSLVSKVAADHILIDLSLARGLDYYTGTICEVIMNDHKDFGSVCSGGRYDNLTSQFINKKLPGVGVSIGLTRLMDLIISRNLTTLDSNKMKRVLVAVYSEEQRAQCNAAAELFRAEGLSAEVYFKSPKLGKQIDYAASCGIPYVLFIDPETGEYQIKSLEDKSQNKVVDLGKWARQYLTGNEV